MRTLVSRRGFAFAAAVTALAACSAALLAHVAIDVFGDYVLARDTYDGLAHASRGEMLAIACATTICALAWIVRAAVDEAHGFRTTRLTVDDLFGPDRLRFVIAVFALAVPALIAMETVDVMGGGGRIDGMADLFGGSVTLGLGIVAASAALVALSLRRVASLLLGSHHVLVAVIGQFFTSIASAPSLHAASTRGLPERRAARRSILSRRFGKRGPPLPAR